MSAPKLSENYESFMREGFVRYETKDIPSCITENINQIFSLREYQRKAIASFIRHYDKYSGDSSPLQLLFNMATGSGKTLIMVMAILYLYERGYRNFIFFVDKVTIIKKTIENFINKGSAKYLFNTEKIAIDGQQVLIKKIENFTENSTDAVNIHFSTIGGLHSRLNNPRENTLTYSDFKEAKTVFISDEAHHINAETKKNKSKDDEENIASWEGTVKKLVNSHRENILLEFTATIDWEHANIYKKYQGRVLFEYDLRQFREDRYSKDIFLLQSNSHLRDRMLQAVLVSQYRRKIAADHKISLKPVILMKSKYVNTGKKQSAENASTSAQNKELFLEIIKNLALSDLARIMRDPLADKDILPSVNEDIFRQACVYFSRQDLAALIQELQIEFSNDKILDINDDANLEDNQLIVNSLEENKIRVVFAVDKLNEGWDVLNLFDIVRLYETQSTGAKTIAEAQLIGRGARYCPFVYKNFNDKYCRKFDDDAAHPLRVIEQLHFHSVQDHRYIPELRSALVASGIHKPQGREITIKVKDSFKESRLYQKGYIWENETTGNVRENIRSLGDAKVQREHAMPEIPTGSTTVTAAFTQEIQYDRPALEIRDKKMSELPIYVVRKALDRIPFYHFNNLQKYFPRITSVDDFIRKENYLGGIVLKIKTADTFPSPQEIFPGLVSVLGTIKNSIKQNSSECVGSKEFHPRKIRDVVKDKTMYIEEPKSGSQQEYGRSMRLETTDPHLDLSLEECNFYVYDDDYGTSEEKNLVKMIFDYRQKFSKEYSEFYLIRNQKIMALFDFDSGRRFEPDYLLFLGNEKTDRWLYYQLFIEPKGRHIEDGDRWKENFLNKLNTKKKKVDLLENEHYHIYGLPFYQSDRELDFKRKLQEVVPNITLTSV